MQIELCGRLCILGSSESHVPGGQPQLVLAYLVWNRDRPVSREELADVLWEAELPATWDVALRGIVRKLRSAIEAAGGDPARTLIQARGGYQLVLPRGSVVDAESATAELAEAQRLLGSCAPDAAEHALTARRIASKTLLPGVEGRWLDVCRAELRQILVAALEVLAQAQVAAARPSEALRAAEEAVVLEPYRESAYRLLMSAHVAAGNRAEALRAYERCRVILSEELGVDPSEETEALYLDLLRDERATPLPAPLARRPLGLVGRDKDIRLLREAWERTRQGALAVVFVAGEPGVGKTRIAAEIADVVHAEGGRVLYGRCDAEPFLAYQPFAEAVGPLAYDGDDRHAMFENVRGALATGRPTLLVVDDLHWADRPTLALLRHLVRSKVPVLLLLTYREPEAAVSPPVAETITSVRHDADAVEVRLEGLSESEARSMIGAWAGHDAPPEVASLLHARTNGNPFFIQEFLRLLAGSDRVGLARGMQQAHTALKGPAVPERIRDVIVERARRLGPHAHDVLLAASVLGPEFDLDVLEAVTAASVLDVVDASIASRLLQDVAPGRVAFAHGLVRDALLGELSAPRRRQLHLRAAEALETRGRAPAAVAHHYLAAGTYPDRGVDAALAAAKEASAQLAFEEAVAWCQRALPIAEGARECEILLELGDARWRAGDLGAARDAYLRGASVARELEDAPLLARAALAIGPATNTEGLFDPDVVTVLEEATRTEELDTETRVRLLVRTAQELYHGAGPERRRALCTEAVAMAAEFGDPSVHAYVLNCTRHAMFGVDDTPEATRIIAHAQRAGDAHMLLEGRNWRVIELLESGDLNGAGDEIDRLAAEAADLRQPFYLRFAPRFRAAIAACRGDDDAAGRWAAEAWEIERRVHPEEAEQHADARLLAVRWQQGRLDEMDDAIRRWTTSGRALPHWAAAHALRSGRTDVALPAPDLYARFALALHADAAFASGDADLAARVYETLVPSAGRVLVVGYGLACIGSLDRWLGLLAGVLGDGDGAVTHLEAALEADERMGAGPAIAHDESALLLLAD